MPPPASAAAAARRLLEAVATSALTPEEPEGGVEGAGAGHSGLPAGPRQPVVVGAHPAPPRPVPRLRHSPSTLSADKSQLRPSVSVRRFVITLGREWRRGLSPWPGTPAARPPAGPRLPAAQPHGPPQPWAAGIDRDRGVHGLRGPRVRAHCALTTTTQGGCHHPFLHPGPAARVAG